MNGVPEAVDNVGIFGPPAAYTTRVYEEPNHPTARSTSVLWNSEDFLLDAWNVLSIF